MTIGGSIEASRSPISDSSNAIAPLYSNRMSMNSCFLAGERKPFPIFIVARRSGVSLDPWGTFFPVIANVEAGDGDGALFGLTPSGNGTFAGSTLRSFRLYIVLTIALHCFLFKTNSYFPLTTPDPHHNGKHVSFRTT